LDAKGRLFRLYSSALHRSALKSEVATHTAITNLFTGRAARSIVNRMVSQLGPIGEAMPALPLAAGAIAPLRAVAEKQGLDHLSSH
jgi:nitronate monooxygenase